MALHERWASRGVGRGGRFVFAAFAAVALIAPVTAPVARADGGFPLLSVSEVGPSGGSMFGGRLADAAVDPSSARGNQDLRIVALGDASVVVASTDGGTSWHRVSTQFYGPPGANGARQRVALTSTDPGGNSILFDPAVDRRVYLTYSGDPNPAVVGVYRSDDGGATWQAPAANQPTCGGGPARMAIGASSDVWVAAGCAVGESHDGGQSFAWTTPDPSGGFHGVAVTPSGEAFACGATGVFARDAAQASGWRRIAWPAVDQKASGFIGCELAADPSTSDVLFVANKWFVGNAAFSGVWEVDRGGDGRWFAANLEGPSESNGRPLVMQTRSQHVTDLYGNALFTGVDVYFGSSKRLSLQHCRAEPTGTAGYGPRVCTTGSVDSNGNPLPPDDTGPWLDVKEREVHSDTARVVFDPRTSFNCVLGVAGDGGFLKPASGDCDGVRHGWTTSNGGLSLQQPFTMSLSLRHGGDCDGCVDIYTATQDNAFFYEHAGAWRGLYGDGGGDDAAYQSVDPVETTGTPIAMLFSSNSYPLAAGGAGYSDPVYRVHDTTNTAPAGWQVPVGGSLARPRVDWLGPGGQHVMVMRDAASPSTMTQAFVTVDNGSTWQPVGPQITDAAGHQPDESDVRVVRTSSSTLLWERSSETLDRVTWDRSESGSTSVATVPVSAGAFGATWTSAGGDRGYVYDCVLVANACIGGLKRISDDSNGNPVVDDDPVLNRLVSKNWYGVNEAVASGDPLQQQPQVIVYNRFNRDVIVVGTRSDGVLVSVDNGKSWGRIPVVVPWVTGAAFGRSATDLYVSTYGGGLWRVSLSAASLRLTRPVPSTQPGTLRTGAHLQTMQGAALTNMPVTFTIVDRGGHTVATASASTNSNGDAAVTVGGLTPGSYTVIADFNQDSFFIVGAETQGTAVATRAPCRCRR